MSEMRGFDMRRKYDYIKLYEKTIAELGFGKMDMAKEHLIELKREVRAIHKRKEYDPQHRIYYDEDGYIERKLLPDYIESMEEAKEYFDEEERITMVYYPWDCTGQLFTSWRKIFKVNGRYVLYHCVSIDI